MGNQACQKVVRTRIMCIRIIMHEHLIFIDYRLPDL
jgi:hypothetical protein